MATHPIGPQPPVVTLPGIIPPAPAIMAVLGRYNRDKIASAVEVMIGLLDVFDGDADLEDATDLEDDHQLSPFAKHYAGKEPGCPIADSNQDAAWAEWHTLPPSRRGGTCAAGGRQEDDEEDDPAGQYDEDAYTGPKPKGNGPGCDISDPDLEHDGREYEGGR